MRPINNKHILLIQISMLVGFLLSLPASAETITVGKGSGIIWEGMPFSATLTGPLNSPGLGRDQGIASISTIHESGGIGCLVDINLKLIGGYQAFPLTGGGLHVGLIPRAQVSAEYTLSDGSIESMVGTIGLPETRAITSSGIGVVSPTGNQWCLPPRMLADENFFNSTAPRTVNISGNWAIVADGNQTSQQFFVHTYYAASYSNAINGGSRTQTILIGGFTLRVSTLECTVNTPTVINFGKVNRNTVVDSELAYIEVPLVASCGQSSDYINANINVQFQALSGLYNNNPLRLALNQGGGYITGGIDHGVTGTGWCKSTTGLSFDGQPIKLGTITDQEPQKVLSRELTWRLCSGGASLPTGKVSAATEMLVTFN